MKNKYLYFFINIAILFSLIFINNVYASEINTEGMIQEKNIYRENEFFKVVYCGEEENPIMPINSLKVFSKKDFKQIGDNWSSSIMLNNGNVILGELNNGQYYYYEINKQGDKNFLIKLNYYIKDIDKETGNYIIIQPYNIEKNQFALGILNKEFKVIYEPIFEYKEINFIQNAEILKLLNGKYGLYSAQGKNIIEPIFDSLSYAENGKINAIYNNEEYILEKYNDMYINMTTIKNIDTWAKEYVLNCLNLGLVSDKLQLKFKEDITREEFCEIIIKLYEMKTGLTIDINKIKNPFTDTNNKSILKAYSLGIVLGREPNKFKPNSFITREEAAVILSNLMKSMGINLKETEKNYIDNNKISSWAYSSVMIVSSEKIMNGYNNYFNPKNFITVQEALVTIFRLYI